jgi:limonene-1,2-epoxide hydrolase
MGNDTTSAAPTSAEVAYESTVAWDRGDLETVLGFYDENSRTVQYHAPDTVIEGREGMRAALEAFNAAIDISDGGVRIISLTAQDERAVTEVEVTGTYRGEGAPEGGARVTLQMCAIFIVEDGIIRQERVYLDDPASQLGRQLGG